MGGRSETGSRLFSLEDAARELGGISVWTLRKHAARGSLAVTHIGRRLFIGSAELARVQSEGLPSLSMESDHFLGQIGRGAAKEAGQ